MKTRYKYQNAVAIGTLVILVIVLGCLFGALNGCACLKCLLRELRSICINRLFKLVAIVLGLCLAITLYNAINAITFRSTKRILEAQQEFCVSMLISLLAVIVCVLNPAEVENSQNNKELVLMAVNIGTFLLSLSYLVLLARTLIRTPPEVSVKNEWKTLTDNDDLKKKNDKKKTFEHIYEVECPNYLYINKLDQPEITENDLEQELSMINKIKLISFKLVSIMLVLVGAELTITIEQLIYHIYQDNSFSQTFSWLVLITASLIFLSVGELYCFCKHYKQKKNESSKAKKEKEPEETPSLSPEVTENNGELKNETKKELK